jgi:hypothetical protein
VLLIDKGRAAIADKVAEAIDAIHKKSDGSPTARDQGWSSHESFLETRIAKPLAGLKRLGCLVTEEIPGHEVTLRIRSWITLHLFI